MADLPSYGADLGRNHRTSQVAAPSIYSHVLIKYFHSIFRYM